MSVKLCVSFFYFLAWSFHELQIPPKKKHLGNLHFVHVISLSSSSHPWRKKEKKKLCYIVSQIKFNFWIIYFCKCNCICLVTRNLDTINQLCIIHNLRELMLLTLKNKQKVPTNCVISYNNQIKEKNCDKKNYKIFLLPWLHTIYTLWTQLLVTCSHMHQKLWKFIITL